MKMDCDTMSQSVFFNRKYDFVCILRAIPHSDF